MTDQIVSNEGFSPSRSTLWTVRYEINDVEGEVRAVDAVSAAERWVRSYDGDDLAWARSGVDIEVSVWRSRDPSSAQVIHVYCDLEATYSGGRGK